MARGLCHQLRRQQLHAAARAAARLLGHDVEVHRAGVGRRLWQQLHAAAWAVARLLGDDFGVHGADVHGGSLDGVEVHLGHEGQRLVRLGGQPRGELLALGRELAVTAQDLERLDKIRHGALVGDCDRAQAVGLLWRAVFQHELAGLLEQHIDDGPLRRSENHVLDELFVLDAAAVAAGELHPSPGQRHLEHARVGGVGQVDAHHLTPLGGQPELRLAGDQQRVAEAAHRRVIGFQAAERRDLAVFEQHVVQRDAQLPMRRPPVVGVRGLDDHVAVEAHLLGVVLADVRVVPVDPGIRERHATGEPAADGDRRLGLVRAVGAIVQA